MKIVIYILIFLTLISCADENKLVSPVKFEGKYGFIDENGDRENTIMIKSDQEPSMKCLVDDVVERRKEGQTIMENSPKRAVGVME